jgi:hypothetical protein
MKTLVSLLVLTFALNANAQLSSPLYQASRDIVFSKDKTKSSLKLNSAPGDSAVFFSDEKISLNKKGTIHLFSDHGDHKINMDDLNRRQFTISKGSRITITEISDWMVSFEIVGSEFKINCYPIVLRRAATPMAHSQMADIDGCFESLGLEEI